MKTIKQKYLIQGDILLMRIKSVPSEAKKLETQTLIMLAEGESAGARHEVINDQQQATAYRLAEGLYLDVQTETDVVHPEHERIALAPGSYKVIRQVEYTRKEIRRVMD
jgi:hypothetical protein